MRIRYVYISSGASARRVRFVSDASAEPVHVTIGPYKGTELVYPTNDASADPVYVTNPEDLWRHPEAYRLYREKGTRPARSSARSRASMIETLYPSYYEYILVGTGKPLTAANIVTIIEAVAQQLALQAHHFFDLADDEAARKRFTTLFGPGGAKDMEHTTVHWPDEMLDWLWAWNSRFHHSLVTMMPQIRDGYVTPDSWLWRVGPDIRDD